MVHGKSIMYWSSYFLFFRILAVSMNDLKSIPHLFSSPKDLDTSLNKPLTQDLHNRYWLRSGSLENYISCPLKIGKIRNRNPLPGLLSVFMLAKH